MNNKLAVITLLAVLAVSGCLGGGNSSSEVEYKTVASEPNTGITEAEFVTVQTQKEWENLIQRMDQPPEAEIDFSQRTVAAVFMGQRNTGGYAVQVTRVVDTGQNVEVYACETSPGPDDITTQALTSPGHIISFQKTDKEVVLASREAC